MKKGILPILFLALICLFGCASNNSSKYYPLRLGNYWIYRANDTGVDVGKMTVKIVKTIHRLDRDWYLGAISGGGSNGKGDYSCVGVNDKGVWQTSYSSIKDQFTANVRLIVPKRIEQSDVWVQNEGETSKILGYEDVVTPAGEFSNCLKVVTTYGYSDIYYVYWYAPHVGLVKLYFAAPSIGGYMINELIDYNVN